jgi:hypothetical protein
MATDTQLPVRETPSPSRRRFERTPTPAADWRDRPMVEAVAADDPRMMAAEPAWAAEVKDVSGLSLVAGLWMIISPWLLSYSLDDSWATPLAAGAIVCVLALSRLAGALLSSWQSWTIAAVGAWVFVGAFLLSESDQALYSQALTGSLLCLLGVWGALAYEAAKPAGRRFSLPWQSDRLS